MTVKEGLKKIRRLLSKRERWTKGELARPSYRSRTSCEVGAPQAKCFCLEGAIQKVAIGDSTLRTQLRIQVRESLPDGECDYIAFNDRKTTTHRQVLALIDRAIEAAYA